MAAEKYPAISVIMPVLNEEAHIADAIESVLAQEYPGDLELLLALGPSSDKTNEIVAAIAKKNKKVRLIDNPRGLTTMGLNECIRQSKSEIIIRIDAHSEPAESYFKRGVEILQEQKADLVGGIMDARGKAAFQSAVAWAYTSRFGIGGANFHVGGAAGEAESAYLGIFKKSALDRVGGYDEEIIRGEDWELAQRIKKTGGLVWFSPELRVVYWPRGTVAKLAKQFMATGIWRGDLTRRDPSGASRRYWIPPLVVFACVSGIFSVMYGNVAGILPTAIYLLGVTFLATVARNMSPKQRLAIMIALPVMHFSWGIGFWRGYFIGAKGKLDRSRVTK
jgi:glycosyltransferase involved in cell wall biosynthesis